jgi:hypothetical protein
MMQMQQTPVQSTLPPINGANNNMYAPLQQPAFNNNNGFNSVRRGSLPLVVHNDANAQPLPTDTLLYDNATAGWNPMGAVNVPPQQQQQNLKMQQMQAQPASFGNTDANGGGDPLALQALIPTAPPNLKPSYADDLTGMRGEVVPQAGAFNVSKAITRLMLCTPTKLHHNSALLFFTHHLSLTHARILLFQSPSSLVAALSSDVVATHSSDGLLFFSPQGVQRLRLRIRHGRAHLHVRW